jgi:glycosyltransferase involved in cell wall biosynthesis
MNRKIKVLNVLATGDMGGAENFVLSLCRHHDTRRFEVMACFLLSGGTASTRIADAGYKVEVLDMTSGFDCSGVLKLISVIRRNGIHVVNTHMETPLGKLGSILSAAPVVVHTDHGVTMASPIKRKPRVVHASRLFIPFIDHFIAISQGMRTSLLIREKVPPEKITLIYNGVEVNAISKTLCDHSELKHSLDLPEGVPILGMVGRLCPEKQYPLLLHALAALKRLEVPFRALIIGDGAERNALEAVAKRLHLNDRVHFLGERNDVFSLLDLIDLFVFSSGGEAFSIAVLEAMAKARPVVGFDVEGVNEAVVNGETGFTVPQGDAGAFAQKIKELLDFPELAHRMGRNAYARANACFNLKENIKRIETLYEYLLKKARFEKT